MGASTLTNHWCCARWPYPNPTRWTRDSSWRVDWEVLSSGQHLQKIHFGPDCPHCQDFHHVDFSWPGMSRRTYIYRSYPSTMAPSSRPIFRGADPPWDLDPPRTPLPWQGDVPNLPQRCHKCDLSFWDPTRGPVFGTGYLQCQVERNMVGAVLLLDEIKSDYPWFPPFCQFTRVWSYDIAQRTSTWRWPNSFGRRWYPRDWVARRLGWWRIIHRWFFLPHAAAQAVHSTRTHQNAHCWTSPTSCGDYSGHWGPFARKRCRILALSSCAFQQRHCLAPGLWPPELCSCWTIINVCGPEEWG